MPDIKSILSGKDLTLALYDRDTILRRLTCGKVYHVFGSLRICSNYNVIATSYFILILAGAILSYFATSVKLQIVANVIGILFLSMFILECNFKIMKEAIVTFDVYYKTVNLCIAMFGYHIDSNFYQSYYNNNIKDYNTLCMVCSGLSIIANSMIIFSVSILDGYNINKYIKLITIILAFLHFLIGYFIESYYSGESTDAIGYLFGYPFHWRTLANSTMTSALVFLIRQIVMIINNPDTLIFIPTFVPFQTINALLTLNYNYNNSNYINNNNNTIESQTLTSYADSHKTNLVALSQSVSIDINPQETIFTRIFVSNNNDNNDNNECGKKIARIIGSTYVLYPSMFYTIFYSIIFIITRGNFNGLIGIILYILFTISCWMGILNFNWFVTKYILSTFVIWWKIQDAVIYIICYQLIDYYNNISWWELKYNTTITQCWIIIIISAINVITAVFGIGTSKAYITFKFNKRYHWIANGFIIAGILHFIQTAFEYFISQNIDYYILISKKYSFSLSCRTITIEKSIDICFFFILQLYTNIKYGLNGIAVTGFVKQKWKQESKYCNIGNIDNHDMYNEMIIDENNHNLNEMGQRSIIEPIQLEPISPL